MGHPTFAELLEQLTRVRDAAYRNEVEVIQTRFYSMESVMQALLEKLRDSDPMERD